MPPKGKSKRTPTKGKGRGRKKAVVPSPQPRRLIPIDKSEKEDLEEREKTAEPSPEELVEEKRQSEAAKKITKRTKKSCRLRDEHSIGTCMRSQLYLFRVISLES